MLLYALAEVLSFEARADVVEPHEGAIKPKGGLIVEAGFQMLFPRLYLQALHPAPSFWLLLWIICVNGILFYI